MVVNKYWWVHFYKVGRFSPQKLTTYIACTYVWRWCDERRTSTAFSLWSPNPINPWVALHTGRTFHPQNMPVLVHRTCLWEPYSLIFLSFWVPYKGPNEDRMPHMYKIIQDKCPKLVPKEHCFNNNNPSVMPWIRHIKLFEPRARSKRSGARSGFSPNITSQSILLLSYVHVHYNPNPDPRLDYQIRSRSPTHTHMYWLSWQRMYLNESSWQMPSAVSK